ncbi:22998_t:CDS:1, partial [Gigaspora rosea]
NYYKEIKCSSNRTGLNTIPKKETKGHDSKNETIEEKKVKFVDSPVVADLDNKPQAEVLTKKLRTENEGLVGGKYEISSKKITNRRSKGNNGCGTRNDLDDPIMDI